MNQNNKPHIIVITGSVATGKSTVTKIVRDLGYEVLDCDQIVHNGYESKSNMYKEVVNLFGDGILKSDESIDREKLGKIVFSDSEKLDKLNSIVHKSVVEQLNDGIEKSTDDIIFLDIPLMIETSKSLVKYGLKYDEIWLVYINPDLQKQRLADRAIKENKDVDETLKIIENQLPIDKKKNYADKIIDNEGTIDDLKQKITQLISDISNKIQ